MTTVARQKKKKEKNLIFLGLLFFVLSKILPNAQFPTFFFLIFIILFPIYLAFYLQLMWLFIMDLEVDCLNLVFVPFFFCLLFCLSCNL